jgi:hypothetical protein
MMISLFAQTAPAFNPEAIINATIASKAAEMASTQVFYISAIILLVLLAVGGAIMFILYKAAELERNTNSMRVDLVEATRKLALLQGNVIGRTELSQESKEEEGKG